jgi:hypothetical protein
MITINKTHKTKSPYVYLHIQGKRRPTISIRLDAKSAKVEFLYAKHVIEKFSDGCFDIWLK